MLLLLVTACLSGCVIAAPNYNLSEISESQTKLATIPPMSMESKEKIGRKERCRHVVQQEVRKYAGIVKNMSDLVGQLQKDLHRMKEQSWIYKQELDSLKENITEQKRVLDEIISRQGTRQKMDTTNSTNQELQQLSKGSPVSLPKDCDEVYRTGGMRYVGTYQMLIKPEKSAEPFTVLCEPVNDAGWVVIQNRQDGSVDFKRTWHDYKKGFGSLQGEFWLGNEKMHHITAQGIYTLRIELEEYSGEKHWAEYSQFSIDNNEQLYRLHIGGYQGTAGDSMTQSWASLDGVPFSTVDMDNDQRPYFNCADIYSAGWWYKNCDTSNLNGRYLQRNSFDTFFTRDGIIWSTIHIHKSLKTVRMMVKPTFSPINTNTVE